MSLDLIFRIRFFSLETFEQQNRKEISQTHATTSKSKREAAEELTNIENMYLQYTVERPWIGQDDSI